MPTPSSLHTDSRLSNLSVQYKNEDMIWRNILPVIRVGKRSDIFTVYDKADSYRKTNDDLGPKSNANEADWGTSTDNYSVKDHGLADWVAQETIDNADRPIGPLVDTNDFLNNNLDINQEKRVSDLVFNTATYPAGNKVTLSGTGQWGGTADDPIGDIQTAIETCFMRANTLILGVETWLVLRKLPEILDAVKSSTRFQGSPGGLATPAEVSGLFEVPNILIGRGRYITSKIGQSDVFSRLWGKHMSALHVKSLPGIKTITFGGTFVESERQTLRDFDVKKGVKGAHYVKVAWNSDEKIIASDLGYMIENAVA